MAKLAAWIASLMVSVFGAFSARIGLKAALVGTLVVTSLALTAGLFVAAKVLVNGLVSAVPYEPFVMGFFSCWPDNAETCIAACFGVDVLVFGYRYKNRLLFALAR